MILGLTGGMGCGKSTVGLLLEDMGLSRIDTDACVRDMLARDPEVIELVATYFGQSVILPEGGINRPALAARVFQKHDELQWLESVLHPRVRTFWETSLREMPEKDWVVEIPLLFEKKLEKAFDITVAVVCSPGKQLLRLMSRGISESEVQARVARQLPVWEKASRADVVIFNEGSKDFLKRQITFLHKRYLRGTSINPP